MLTRAIGSVLWFLVTWAAAGLLCMAAGAPTTLGLVPALAIGAVIWSDPGERLWGPRVDRALVRRRIADLERVSTTASGTAPERQAEPAAD